MLNFQQSYGPYEVSEKTLIYALRKVYLNSEMKTLDYKHQYGAYRLEE